MRDPLGRATILVVEDDRATSDLLRDAFEDEGFRCIAASSGEVAVQLARDETPSLITLDLDLPDTDGHSVLHRLRADQQTAAIPVMVVSCFDQHLPEHDRHSVAGVLHKPVDVSELTAAAREAIAAE